MTHRPMVSLHPLDEVAVVFPRFPSDRFKRLEDLLRKIFPAQPLEIPVVRIFDDVVQHPRLDHFVIGSVPREQKGDVQGVHDVRRVSTLAKLPFVSL